MLQSWYNSDIVREEKKIPLSFSPAIHYFCSLRAVRTGNAVWFCLKNAEKYV